MPVQKSLGNIKSPNFSFLEQHEPMLVKYAAQAEKYLFEDPNTSLIKLRQFVEVLAQQASAYAGVFTTPEESLIELLERLYSNGILSHEIKQLFHGIRKAGNNAVHSHKGTYGEALYQLRMARTLAVWFHRSFAQPEFDSGPFLPPPAPKDAEKTLQDELARLRDEVAHYRQQTLKEKTSRHEAEIKAKAAYDDLASALKRIKESDEIQKAEKRRFQNHITKLQNTAAKQSKKKSDTVLQQAQTAALQLDLSEADTRRIIDQQLREAGWETDSIKLKYSKGARPQKGKYRAIAEWPTESGPADYVLFFGKTALAVVEAKKKAVDVAGAIDQAKRYSRTFLAADACDLPAGPWDKFRIPFVFSANGKRFLQQLRTQTGIWFCDLRRPQNLRRSMDGWYSPEGLNELYKQNIGDAETKLQSLDFDFGFKLRDYQIKAIRHIEDAITEGKPRALLSMATGTGKTKTCIALIYRLLLAQRFRRILFVVDRSALGEQAANAFKETNMDSTRTFTDIFGIKELADKLPESNTKVHFATIQGLVKRLLYNEDDQERLTVDQFDCIVVDECHRGYLLDRELSDSEINFRDQNDYISKYRRVLDYFDATKIGLTATPALHTTEIFGEPIYSYSYREAVIDGYLIDHEPPFQIKTKLAKDGITWGKGEVIQVYDPRKDKIDLVHTPDEVTFEVDEFNKKVITEPFNRVVCAALAQYIDPSLPGKTLVFCATDKHADMVVALLKEEFQKIYGEIEDDAVTKITGTADKPLQLIRRYKNERLPNVAVTVDLLTTGIDVPEICNLVFLRRINSRILYEQMLGRATRRCDEIEKAVFHVYDAVDIYANLAPVSDMKPVIVNPTITYAQLIKELISVKDENIKVQARDQIIAKLRRKKQHLNDKGMADFETSLGMTPDEFIETLQRKPLKEVISWFTKRPELGEVLERDYATNSPVMFVSDHQDSLLSIDRGYGSTQKPDDYLDSFRKFISDNSNKIPALLTVLQRPRELTRKDLKALLMELDQKGFTEKNLETAWHQKTNQDIAARIIGFIRQAALGDPLIPWEQRVEQGVAKILQKRQCTPVQRQWLNRIAAQMKRETIVDREALDAGVFKAEGGGFKRIDKIFDGQLEAILLELNDALWAQKAA